MSTGNSITEGAELDDIQMWDELPSESDEDSCIPTQITELLTIQLEIPAELEEEIDFMGDFCSCDLCEQARRELTRQEQEKQERPVRLSAGKTAFHLGDRLIYCDCLEGFLKNRQVML